jgi:hypothetical protein
MIAELAAGVSFGFAVMNGVIAYFLFRQYRLLADETVDFAGKVLSLLWEEDGEIAVNPVALAGETMDHMSRMSGIVEWIRER